MSDEAFQLTPLDIRTQQFGKAMRGYDTAAVEDFRERAAAEVERLLRERAVADEQVTQYREQLDAFRQREKAMSDALVAAQAMREQAETAARDEADAIVADARSQAKIVLDEAREAEREIQLRIQAARKQLSSYLAAFRVLLERNLAEVEAVEAQERNGRVPGGGASNVSRATGAFDEPTFRPVEDA